MSYQLFKRFTRILCFLLLLAGVVSSISVCAKEGAKKISAVSSPAPELSPAETKAASDHASDAQTSKSNEKKSWIDYIIPVAALAIPAASVLFVIFKYSRRNADARQKKKVELTAQVEHESEEQDEKYKTNEHRYRACMREELLKSSIFGMSSANFDASDEAVDLTDTFVSLDLDPADTIYSDGFETDRIVRTGQEERLEDHESALRKALSTSRILVIIGEPGSGKTTIINHFALNHNLQLPGFSSPAMVMYLPLINMRSPGEERKSLVEKLSEHFLPHLQIEAEWFREKLNNGKTLVLLDGLDEISDSKQRVEVCRWISKAAGIWTDTFFVMTTRDKGYSEQEKKVLTINKRVAYVKRFSDKQQREFLEKWFRAALNRDDRREHPDKSEEARKAVNFNADEISARLVQHLAYPENRSLKELAGTPLLLQMMAIFYKRSHALPSDLDREKLYAVALDYLLQDRDDYRKLKPLLPAKQAKIVLAPVALWMQDHREEISAGDDLNGVMQQEIDRLGYQYRDITASSLMSDLVKRNSVIDQSGNLYRFRHKTFREYLAAMRLISLMDEQQHSVERLSMLAGSVGESWWEEPLLFFMAQSSIGNFEKFMQAFFNAERSKILDEKTLTFLKELILKVPQTSLSVFKEVLSAQGTSLDENEASIRNRQSFALECLKTIGSRAAVEIAQEFIKHNIADKELIRKAQEVVEYNEFDKEVSFVCNDLNTQEPTLGKPTIGISDLDSNTKQALLDVFQSSVEPGAQYILIKGGSYLYSVTGKDEDIDDLYVAKYPVTNRLYRRFINYLQSEDNDRANPFPVADFQKKLSVISAGIDGFSEYLNNDEGIVQLFRSKRDDDRRFKEDEQPVVSISWYAARAYCLWLSMIESGGKKDDLYRLPTEIEWVWAAAGKEQREYPWRVDEQPSPKLANYGDNVGATTPVGSYPDGATPEGLYDMAGNVWEWMENLSGDKDWPSARALRGGSWSYSADYLRCSARNVDNPAYRNGNIGFRVVRPGLAVEP